MLLPELMKGLIGGYDLLKSKQYSKAERPAYEIPPSDIAALESAKSQALQTQLPGQSLTEEKLAGTTAQAISSAKQATDSPTNLLGIISQLQEHETGKIRDLAAASAENYNSNQGVLRTQLGKMAAEEANKWEWDKAKPYLASMATAANLQKAGETNIMAGIEGASNMIMADKYYSLMYPQGIANDETDGTLSPLSLEKLWLKLQGAGSVNPYDKVNKTLVNPFGG
jgi:hypothetical protein